MTPVQYFNAATRKRHDKQKCNSNVCVKKKSLKYENEMIKRQELAEHLPNEYGDRFIPRRYLNGRRTCTQSSFNLTNNTEEFDIFRLKATKGYWRLFTHCHNIKSSLGLDIVQNVLHLHDWITRALCKRSMSNLANVNCIMKPQPNAGGLDWPCKPRPVPLAYNDSTHDLPDFHRFSNYNIIAWSSQGKIAASFGRDLVLWGPPSAQVRQKITTVYRVGMIRSLAFNASGTMLALGMHETNKSTLEIYQLIQEKNDMKFSNVPNKEGICEIGLHSIDKVGLDDIRAIEWGPNEKHIICGMQSGHLHKINRPIGMEMPKDASTTEYVEVCHFHENCISHMAYSLNSTFVAIVDYGGKLSIRQRKQFKDIYHSIEDTDFFAWHPWNENDLFIGSSLPATIRVFDLTTKTVLAFYQRSDIKCSLDAMTVNPLSAELVAAFTREDQDGAVGCDILVMGSMNRVVDNLSAHINTVNFLLWSPNGTHIATAGNDETLNIWNFFGMSQRKANELMEKKEKAQPNSKLSLDYTFKRSR